MNVEAFQGIYRGKSVLVTGHTGFKGAWLSIWLQQLGARVTGLALAPAYEQSLFQVLGLASSMDHHEGDIRDASLVKEVILKAKPDFVFHLAAQALVSVSYENPLETLSTNAMGTANVLEGLRALAQEKKKCAAVMVTSDKCYDNVEWTWGYRETDALGGKDIYSGSKAMAEHVFKSYFHTFLSNSSVRVASARAGNVIGGGDWARDRIVPDSVRAWRAGRPVVIRAPESTRPWQHVLEPLSGYLQLAHFLFSGKCNGESYNFGPPADCNISVRQLISDLAVHWGLSGEKVFQTKESPLGESRLLKLNCDKALAALNWVPCLGYPETVRMVGEWYTSSDPKKVSSAQIQEYESLAQSRKLNWKLA